MNLRSTKTEIKTNVYLYLTLVFFVQVINKQKQCISLSQLKDKVLSTIASGILCSHEHLLTSFCCFQHSFKGQRESKPLKKIQMHMLLKEKHSISTNSEQKSKASETHPDTTCMDHTQSASHTGPSVSAAEMCSSICLTSYCGKWWDNTSSNPSMLRGRVIRNDTAFRPIYAQKSEYP